MPESLSPAWVNARITHSQNIMENENVALFTNFTTEKFTGHWNGKPYVFQAGQAKWLPEFLARHFAKHITNQELLRRDKNNNNALIHPNGDKCVSPKKPEDVPQFMEIFNRAFTAQEPVEGAKEKNEVDVAIELANKNKEAKENPSTDLPTPAPAMPTVPVVPNASVNENTEEGFEGQPQG